MDILCLNNPKYGKSPGPGTKFPISGATEPRTPASAKRRASEWGTEWSPVKTLGIPRENQGIIQKIAGKPWYQWENSMIHGPFYYYVRHKKHN